MNNNLKKTIKVLSAVAISVVLVWLLAREVNLLETFELMQKMPMHWLMVGFVCYMLGHLGRTMRFYRLLEWKRGFNELFSIVCVHNLFVDILPARTGELSYLYMTKKRDIPLTKGAPVLLIVRILDVSAIAIILLFSVLMAGISSPFLALVAKLVGAILALCLSLLFVLVYCGDSFVHGLRKILSLMFNVKKSHTLKWVLEKSHEIAESFKTLRTKANFVEELAYSVFIWGIRFVMFYLVIISLGIDVGIWLGVIGVTLPLISTFLPIQGFGGFGTLEGAWTISFIGLGISKETAIISGFAFHIILLVFAFAAGLYGLLGIWLAKQQLQKTQIKKLVYS